jgi:hypothetical protein
MQLPESINKLTTDVPASALTSPLQTPPLVLDDLVVLVRRALTTKELTDFEFGLAYFNSDTTSDRQIIKNYIKMLCEAYIKSLKESTVNEEYKDSINTGLKQTLDALQQGFDALYNVIINLNEQKNLLDPKQISLIILGYAIGTIKKIYNR